MTYRIAIIGVTGYAGKYLETLRALIRNQRIRITAAVVINPDEAASELQFLRQIGTTVYSDYQEMLASQAANIDLCIIPTGIAWHKRMTVEALSHGLNVLVEKPIAATLQDVRDMAEAEKASSGFVAVGFQDIYQSSVQNLKQQILNGVIGKPVHIKSKCLWPRRSSYFLRNDWAGRLHNGNDLVLDSPANNAMAHFINLNLFLCGSNFASSSRVAELSAEIYRVQKIQSFDMFCFKARLASGVKLSFWGSHSNHQLIEPEIIIEGDQGTASWNSLGEVIIKGSTQSSSKVGAWDENEHDGRLAMLEAVLRRIHDPKQFVCTIDLAKEHTRLVNALHDYFPIVELDHRHLTKNQDDDDSMVEIRGLHHDLSSGFQRNKMFSELGLEWSQGTETISLHDYDHFKGRLIPCS
ncbi:MAG: Gfo/Idh/MocA family oxidoreductase [Verrucomicrobiota bacterium]